MQGAWGRSKLLEANGSLTCFFALFGAYIIWFTDDEVRQVSVCLTTVSAFGIEAWG